MHWTKRTFSLLFLGVALLAARGAAAAAPEAAWGKIELLRDQWGTPHVFAQSDEGAMYGLGVATAEDRGFQMTWSLRIIQGRSAEVLGDRAKGNGKETTVQSDRKMRTFGFHRAARETARRLDHSTLALLEAYSRGVNDSFAAQGKNRHYLFDKLGLEPEPWTPADCIASWWHLGQFFAGDGTRDLMRLRSLGNEAGQPGGGAGGRELRIPAGPGGRERIVRRPGRIVPDDAASVIQRGDVTDEWVERVNAFAREHGLQGTPKTAIGEGPKFSHAWVVGGAKTGGGAVLMSDPQTPVANPALFYEFHIQGKTFNARGIGVPGSPALLIGWTGRVAWGLTALGADQADLFMLKTDPARADEYRLDEKWRKMETVEEKIRVRGGRDQDLKVRLTHFGPIVNEFAFAGPQDPPVALKRIPMCETSRETFQGVLAMMRARNAAEFSEALEGWRFPTANIVFGDRDGTIGFWLLGPLPIRAPGAPDGGGAAMDGSATRGDWQGFIPHDLVPHMMNPKRGWIASANHRAIASFYPIAQGTSTGSMGDTIRSWRLRERLEARERFSPRDVLDIHYDKVNPARREIARLGLHLRDALGRDLSPDARAALDVLKPWLAAGAPSDLASPGAVLALKFNTMFRIVQTDLAANYGGGESGLARFLKEARGKIEKDSKAPFGDLEREYVDGLLADAWRQARAEYGNAPERWPEQAQAQARRRVMGYYQSLDGFGSLDRENDLNFPALTCIDGGTINSQAAQAYTQWVPLGDVDKALSILPPGASERPDGQSRASAVSLWSRGELHPAPLSRAAVEPFALTVTELSREKKKE